MTLKTRLERLEERQRRRRRAQHEPDYDSMSTEELEARMAAILGEVWNEPITIQSCARIDACAQRVVRGDLSTIPDAVLERLIESAEQNEQHTTED